MPARLIVNADDFGLTRGINNAIIELHAAGALTSATLMANGPAFHHAVALARKYPALAVGCHIVLTDGTPVLPPEEIPTLLGPDHKTFRPSLKDFVLAVLRRQINPDDVQREAIAQIHLLKAWGLRVTHIDTHKHVHILPQIARAVLQAAQATNVHAIRNPLEPRWALRFGYKRPARMLSVGLTRLLDHRFLAQPVIRSGSVLTTNGTIGISATGLLDEHLLREIIQALPDGLWELVCHPGYNDLDLDAITTRLRTTREVERHALLAVLSRNQTSPHPPLPELIHYGRL